MPSGKKRKRHKVATHKRKKRRRANRHKKKKQIEKVVNSYFFGLQQTFFEMSSIKTRITLRSLNSTDLKTL